MTKVLIVDDSEIDLLLEDAILERCGYQTFTATDGDEALRICAEHEIDIVVTDLHMPTVHGFELISRLRDLSPKPSIIAVSGTGPEQLDIAHALGALFTIQKPLSPDKLVAAVQQIVTARERMAKERA